MNISVLRGAIPFLARDSSALCPSVRPSVCHTCGSVKDGWS